MYISNGYLDTPTKITIDGSDTINAICAYIHMTSDELCEIIQKIIDDDLDNHSVSNKFDEDFIV